MKQTIFLFTFLLLLSCDKQDPTDQITNLSGYWEIQNVSMPDGSERSFKMSTMVDFIEINGEQGVRKKVSPKLDGTFTVNDSAEKFTLRIENDSLRIYYETPFDSWKETIITAKDDLLKVKNPEGKIYTYKRFRNFNLPE